MNTIYALFDFIIHIDKHLLQLVADYGVFVYAILFLIILCETGLVVTPFLPGDSLLFVAGTIAATGQLNVHLLAAILLAAAILGDTLNYTIGRNFGMKLFANPESKIFRRSYLERTHAFYEKHGGKTIIIARFVPIVRTFAPFVAGIGRMSYGKFLLFNVIGASAWVLGITYLGFFLGGLPIVKSNLSLFMFGIIILSIMPGIVEVARQKWFKKSADELNKS